MPGETDLKALLQAAPYFASLSGLALDALASSFSEVRYGKGELIFSRGDASTYLLLVSEGRVQISLLGDDGRELDARQIKAGAVIGEIGVMDGLPRSADAVAATPVSAFLLRKAQIDALIDTHPPIARAIIKVLCQRLRETTEQMEGIALRSIEERLARYLLAQVGDRPAPSRGRIPVELGLTQTELARLLGASRPKVNVAFGRLEKAGALKRTSDRLFCDLERLKTWTESTDA
jgi:CRP-like cAMP-binding protein